AAPDERGGGEQVVGRERHPERDADRRQREHGESEQARAKDERQDGVPAPAAFVHAQASVSCGPRTASSTCCARGLSARTYTGMRSSGAGARTSAGPSKRAPDQASIQAPGGSRTGRVSTPLSTTGATRRSRPNTYAYGSWTR